MSSSATHPRLAPVERLRRGILRLLREHRSSDRLAAGTAVGAFVGCTPFFGLHAAIGAILSRVLRLNLLAVLAGTQVSLPFSAPFIVFASVQIGHRALTGAWLDTPGLGLEIEVAGRFLLAWSVGSIAVGGLTGLTTFFVVRGVLSRFRPVEPTSRWSGRSRGSGFGYRLFFFFVRTFGRRFAYWALHPVVFFYFLFDRSGRRESRRFFERMFGPEPFVRRQKNVWLHFTALGRSLVDRLMMLAGRPDAFVLEGHGFEHLERAHAGGRGVVLLSAHFGAWALAGHLLKGHLRPTVVVFDNEARAIREFFARNPGESAPKIIVFNEGPTASIEILRSLRSNEVVAMLADRVAPGRPAFSIPFGGGHTRLPAGPFQIAALAGAPIVMTFNHKTAPDRLSLSILPPIPMHDAPRDARDARALDAARRYAEALEAVARRHPHQWFNFFDFWAEDGS